MYFYSAYGLNIHSALALPELITGGVEADVVIRIGKIEFPPSEVTIEDSYFHMMPEQAYFFWNIVGKFLVRHGKEIIIDPVPEVDERAIRLPLLGTILAVLLHQRRYFVLHASAIAVDGGVVAFLGDKGQGKSTMAATLYSRGHNLVADDTVALDLSDLNNPTVLPGFPQFKLWPEAAASSLGDNPEALPQLVSGYDKRARRIVERFSQQPLPLKHLCVLSRGSAPALQPLPPQEAIVQLITNSYVARFGNQLLQGVAAVTHLKQCTSLIEKVPVSYLERPRSLELLPEIAQLVEVRLARDNQLALV